MCKTIKKPVFVAWIVFLVMLGLMIGIISYLHVTFSPNKQEIDRSITNVTEIQWFDSNGNSIEDPYQLYKHGMSSYIYTVIPRDLSGNVSFCFETRHVDLDIYIGDNHVYNQPVDESGFYTNSTGSTIVTIPIYGSDYGKIMKINYTLFYEGEKNCGIYNATYTSGENFILTFIKSKIPIIFLSMIYVIYGVILIILDFTTYKHLKYRHDFFYLGCLILAVAAYSIFETRLLQMFIMDPKLIHLMKRFVMILIPLPLVAYGGIAFGYKHSFIMTAFAFYDMITFLVTTFLNYYDIVDYHGTNIWILSNIGIALMFMIYAIVRHFVIAWRKYKHIDQYSWPIIIGLIVIISTAVLDIVNYGCNGTIDNAFFVRIGFFFFIVCLSVMSSKKIVAAFKTKAQMTVISKLAYQDGLTNLWNRTSYNEDLNNFEIQGKEIGIVMLDVNNLKFVNDTYGHDIGDEMLISGADIIKAAYNNPGMKVYRIGGDEFVVLIDTENCEKDYRMCDAEMRLLYSEFNQSTDQHFKIVIASGFCKYDPNEHVNIEAAVKIADADMYVHKKRLKSCKYLNVMV